MSKTLAKRLRKAERQAAGMEKELRYLRENRVRYAQALREAEGELRTLRAVLAVLVWRPPVGGRHPLPPPAVVDGRGGAGGLPAGL